MQQDVFILGATGRVGRILVKQILTEGDTDPHIHRNPTNIVGLASSTDFVYAENGLGDEAITSFLSVPKAGHESLVSLDALLDDAIGRHQDLVFVDVTAVGEEMYAFHNQVLEHSPFSVVTANKLPLANSSYEDFRRLTNQGSRDGYRCSVMAGAEAVSFIRDLKDLHDSPVTIEGCFSGTLGYLSSQLEQGIPFSAAIRKAHELGYTEPDPRDDLNGMDVARKLLILARTAGYPVYIGENLQVNPFVPQEFLEAENGEEFLANAEKADRYFALVMDEAKSKGNTLRYVAEFRREGEGFSASVGLREVPIASSLGSLQGTDNKIVITTRTYPAEHPYKVEAPGAGLEITAQNVRRDLLYLLHGREQII